MNTPAPTHVERLARSISEHGLTAVSLDELRRIADVARRLGASTVLASVLLDPTQPEVARIRAFGRLTSTLLRASRPSSAGVLVGARAA